tara:strand:- start:5945 stop:8944 length:3000 start_codon:yes stop_codon:yes gene_type:complete
MAPQVKKSAKINFYKFVSPVKVTGKMEDAAVVKAQNSTTSAINNLGKTLNSLAKVLTEFRDNQVKLLQSFEATAPKKFIPKFNKPEQSDPLEQEEEEQGSGMQAPGWLESIFNLIKDFISLAIVGPALAWLSDPENRQSIVDTLETIGKIFEIIGGFVTDRVKGAIDGLYDFFKEDASWWERLTGFLKGFGNFALLMIGLRWLTNPVKMVKDIGKVINTFWKVLKALGTGLTKRGLGKGRLPATGGGRRRGGVAGTLLTIGAGVGTGMILNQAMQGGEPEEKAKGGKLKQRAGGGFINGPMSGYPVSMDGGNSTSFIGHGLEYVAQKSSGGFVVPINTPATKNNPGLMGQRMTEASRMGYDLGGMFSGFDGGGEFRGGKPQGKMKERSKKEEKRFQKLFMAAGGELGKLGDGTRLVNAARGMCTTGVLETAEANNAKVGAPHVATARDPNNPRGLMAQAVKDFGYAALNIGQPKKITSPYGHVNVKEMNFGQWKKAVKGNKVPSGSLVFSTRHTDWNNSASSSGNDSAIAKNGGRKLWSGHWQAVVDGVGAVYGAGTKKVVALVHPSNHKGGYDGKGGNNEGGGSEMALSGKAKELVGSDKPFLKEVKRVAGKVGVHPSDLLGLMASESGLNPQAQNKSGATGLIQFMPATAAGLGTSTAALKQMNRVEQMKYVEKFLLKTVPKGATPGHLYTAVYLPAFAKKDANYVLAKKGGFTDDWGHHPASWYTQNSGLDQNNDGQITIGELGKRIEKKKREFGITGGGSTGSYTGDSSNVDGTDDSGNSINGIAPQLPSNPMEALSSLQSGLFSAFGMDASSSTPPTSQAAASAKQGNKSGTTGAGQDKLGPGHMRSGKGAGTPGAGASGDSTSDTKPGSTAGASNVGGVSAPPSVPPAASSSGAGAVTSTGSTSSSAMVSQTGNVLKAKQNRQKQLNQNLASVANVAAQQNQQVQALAAQSAGIPEAAPGGRKKPKVISTGGSGSRDLVSQLNSSNNPMRSSF